MQKADSREKASAEKWEERIRAEEISTV